MTAKEFKNVVEFMSSKWNEKRAAEIFGEGLGRHFWKKWRDACEEVAPRYCGADYATMQLFCNFSQPSLQKLIDYVEDYYSKKYMKDSDKKKEFNALLEKYKGSKIDCTPENLLIVMQYLNSQNWGSWDLPPMSQGYNASQYNCGRGEIATTIVLDEGVKDYTGKTVKKLQFGAPRGYLSKYESIRNLVNMLNLYGPKTDAGTEAGNK